MRLENWNPNKFDESIENVAIDRFVEAGEIIAKKARSNLKPKLNLSRPAYKSGKYKGLNWTSRDAGRLKKSIRVSRKKTKSGKAFSRKRNIRIYAGHFTAYYPYWVEFGTTHHVTKKTKKGIENNTFNIPAQPFLRPAFHSSISQIKSILGVR